MGGYASFQKAGIAAKPIKGSALFYYNSPDEMKEQDRTILRCPVLMGIQESNCFNVYFPYLFSLVAI